MQLRETDCESIGQIIVCSISNAIGTNRSAQARLFASARWSAIALANKMARIAWARLARVEPTGPGSRQREKGLATEEFAITSVESPRAVRSDPWP